MIDELKTFIPQYDKSEKFIQQEKWVEEMIGEGRQEEAINRAQTLGVNGESYTNVYKAIEMVENKGK